MYLKRVYSGPGSNKHEKYRVWPNPDPKCQLCLASSRVRPNLYLKCSCRIRIHQVLNVPDPHLCLQRGVGQQDDLSGQQTAGACAQVGKTERGRHRVDAAFSVPTDQPLKISVLRIHDILVWIRIRIRGSMPLTNGSGCESGSFYLKVLLHHFSKVKS